MYKCFQSDSSDYVLWSVGSPQFILQFKPKLEALVAFCLIRNPNEYTFLVFIFVSPLSFSKSVLFKPVEKNKTFLFKEACCIVLYWNCNLFPPRLAKNTRWQIVGPFLVERQRLKHHTPLCIVCFLARSSLTWARMCFSQSSGDISFNHGLLAFACPAST